MAVRRKQAGEQFAFRRDAHPRAGMAERLGDTRDHPDLAAPILVTPSRGGLAVVIRGDLFQGQLGVDAADDLGRWNHLSHFPAVAGAHIHELDEAQDVWRAFEAVSY